MILIIKNIAQELNKMDKSEELIKRITPLFLETGYWNLRVDDIAAKLNISKKTLYIYFDNKKDIIWRVLQNNLNNLEKLAQISEENSPNAIESVISFMNGFYGYIGTEQDKQNLEELEKYYPEILVRYKGALLELIQRLLQKNYERGVREGYYKPEHNPEYVGRFFSMVYNGNRTMVMPKENVYSFEKLRIMSAKIIMYGLVSPKGAVVLDELYASYKHLNPYSPPDPYV